MPLHEWKYEGTYPPASKVDYDGNLSEAEEPNPLNTPLGDRALPGFLKLEVLYHVPS